MAKTLKDLKMLFMNTLLCCLGTVFVMLEDPGTFYFQMTLPMEGNQQLTLHSIIHSFLYADQSS